MSGQARPETTGSNAGATDETQLTFFGIGPQRTASTWLYTALSTHPRIAFPHQVKETMFFDQHFDRGLEWYLWHFRNRKDDQICGEVGPTYFDDDLARERIKECFPDAEIFINVRNPIARSHSLFRHHLSKGRVPNSFQGAIDKMPRIVDSGRYREHCMKWEESFGDRITYLVQEDIQEDPDTVLQFVFQRIGIETVEVPEQAKERINTATAPRSLALARVLSFTATTLRSLRLHSLVEYGKKLGLKKVYSGSGEVDPMTPEMYQSLAGIFEPDIQWLEQRLGRDLSIWRNFETGK
ncbi:MAG: sulfotransferase domain-containing protein [Planctomycetota bacterium]